MTRARDVSNLLGTSGTNGQVLTIDNAQSNGFAFENPAQYVAGKNKIINGDFGIWQRGTSFTVSGNQYTADRWVGVNANTIARSTDVPAGFTYSANWTTSGSYPTFVQSMELPATAARGQFTGTWTLSFWAKASASIGLTAGMGWTDDSIRNNQVGLGEIISNITTSWARYSVTYNLSSANPVSTSKALSLYFYVVTGGATVYITGVQFEQGSVATPFTTASGTLQGELALAQRYYYRHQAVVAYDQFAQGFFSSSTGASMYVKFPTTMRVTPTVLDYQTPLSNSYYRLINWNNSGSLAAAAVTAMSINSGSTPDLGYLGITSSGGMYIGVPSFMDSNGTASPWLGFSAEL
jgi:hypothetical protein